MMMSGELLRFQYEILEEVGTIQDCLSTKSRQLEVSQLLGTWYEVARLPPALLPPTGRLPPLGVKAEYLRHPTRPDTLVVHNTVSGSIVVTGWAEKIYANAFRVTFPTMVVDTSDANHYILAVDRYYRWLLTSNHPVWLSSQPDTISHIMSRTPEIPPTWITYYRILMSTRMGFTPDQLTRLVAIAATPPASSSLSTSQ